MLNQTTPTTYGTIAPTSPSPPSSSKLTIRPAKYSELWQCAQVLGKSFFDHELFGDYIHPHKDRYPDDVALYFYRSMQVKYWDWGTVFLVAVEVDERSGREEVAGVAQWHRAGDGARENGWKLGVCDIRNLLTPLSHLQTLLCSTITPNRALCPRAATILSDGEPFTEHIFTTPPSRGEHWFLHFLGVHPSHQNKGIGRLLVAWGLDQARREDVGAFVISAYGKDAFYRRCGYRELLGCAGQGEGNPLGVIPGGNIWWVGREGLRKVEEEEGDSDSNGDVVVRIEIDATGKVVGR